MTRILEERIAVVTGGGQGLGQAISLRLAKEGCHVVVADINEAQAKETAALIESETDRRSTGMKVDVTNEDEVAEMIDQTVSTFGRLDLLVVNAGILIAGETDQFPADKWRAVIDVNLNGYFLSAKHAAES